MAADTISDLEETLNQQTRLHGVVSKQAAAIMVGLGRACLEQKRDKQAEIWLRKALAIQEQLGEDSQTIAATRRELNAALANLPNITQPEDELTVSSARLPVFGAVLQKAPDEFEQAVENYQIEIDSLRQRGAFMALADTLLKLAKLYGRRKMFTEMEPLLVEALRIRAAELGIDHLSVSIDLKNLAKLYYFQRRYDDAEQLFRRAMNTRAAALGPLHPHVADVARWYAKSLRACNRLAEAEAMETLVRESEAQDGTDWDNYKSAAVKAIRDENYPMAEAMWLAALEEAKNFSDDDPRLCATLENLAELYWMQAKYTRAESLCQRILHISERILGSSHPDVAQAANNFALVCERQGKYAEATMLYQQALTILENVHGTDDANVIALRECYTRSKTLMQKAT